MVLWHHEAIVAIKETLRFFLSSKNGQIKRENDVLEGLNLCPMFN